MKSKINILIIVILFILGIGFMSYPFISDYLARLWQADIISEYDEQIDSLSDTSLDEALDKAKAAGWVHYVDGNKDYCPDCQ